MQTQQDAIMEGLQVAGMPELYTPLMEQFPYAQIDTVEYQPGETFHWMLFRPNGVGSVKAAHNITWGGKASLSGYEFFIDVGDKRYIFGVPLFAGNLALKDVIQIGPERIVKVPGPERVVEVPALERIVEIPGPSVPERIKQVKVPVEKVIEHSDVEKINLSFLGNYSFSKSFLTSEDDVKEMMTYQRKSIKEGLRQAGFSELFEPLVQQLSRIRFNRVAYDKGQKFMWMLFKTGVTGDVYAKNNIIWDESTPLAGYEFSIDLEEKRYTFAVPFWGNLALKDINDIERRPLSFIGPSSILHISPLEADDEFRSMIRPQQKNNNYNSSHDNVLIDKDSNDLFSFNFYPRYYYEEVIHPRYYYEEVIHDAEDAEYYEEMRRQDQLTDNIKSNYYINLKKEADLYKNIAQKVGSQNSDQIKSIASFIPQHPYSKFYSAEYDRGPRSMRWFFEPFRQYDAITPINLLKNGSQYQFFINSDDKRYVFSVSGSYDNFSLKKISSVPVLERINPAEEWEKSRSALQKITQTFNKIKPLHSIIRDYLSNSKSYAVIIGIDKYTQFKNGYSPLPYAVKDAKDLRGYLITHLGFKEKNIKQLYNEKATKSNIEHLLGQTIPSLVKEEDRLLIYFSGHGDTITLDNGNQYGYLIAYDSKKEELYSSSVSMGRFTDYSNLIPAKQILFIVDSCYSGIAGIINKDSERDELRVVTEAQVKLFMQSRGRQILTAGASGEKVKMGKRWNDHSVFTHYLLKGLEGKEGVDRNKDGVISVRELQSYVATMVSKDTRGQQNPQIYDLGDTEGQFIFYREGDM